MTVVRARLLLLTAGVLGFGVVLALVRIGSTAAMDLAALDLLSSLHGGPLDPVMIATTDLGSAKVLGYLTIVAAGWAWSVGSRGPALFLIVGYVLSGIVSDALKAAIARPRPPATFQIPELLAQTDSAIWATVGLVLAVMLWRSRWRWPAVAGAAFMVSAISFDAASISTPGLDSLPSGHALRSIILTLSVLYISPTRPGRPALIAVAAVLLAIGVSRLYLGHHYPTDVVAGWFAGLALLSAMSLIPPFGPAAIRQAMVGGSGESRPLA
jgi:membrane-associated phospholipid phosphatase